jgi:hypothetical protein
MYLEGLERLWQIRTTLGPGLQLCHTKVLQMWLNAANFTLCAADGKARVKLQKARSSLEAPGIEGRGVHRV